VVARAVFGAPAKLLKRDLGLAEYGSSEQLRRARGYASKLHQIVEDVAGAPALKTLVIVHAYAHYGALPSPQVRRRSRRL
jgi:hypothetical protein